MSCIVKCSGMFHINIKNLQVGTNVSTVWVVSNVHKFQSCVHFGVEFHVFVLKNFSRINTHIWTLTDLKLAYIYTYAYDKLLTRLSQTLNKNITCYLKQMDSFSVQCQFTLFMQCYQSRQKIRWHFISYHHTCICSIKPALQVEVLQVYISTVWFLLNNVTFSKHHCQWNYRNTRKHIYI